MIAADMAPGMNRSFLAEDWKHLVPRKCWYDALEEAQDRVNTDIQTDIQGYDIDAEARKQHVQREDGRCGRTDSFPAACSEGSQPSEAVWVYYHQSALWRASGRKRSASAALP